MRVGFMRVSFMRVSFMRVSFMRVSFVRVSFMRVGFMRVGFKRWAIGLSAVLSPPLYDHSPGSKPGGARSSDAPTVIVPRAAERGKIVIGTFVVRVPVRGCTVFEHEHTPLLWEHSPF
jgi:hypothetical protein